MEKISTASDLSAKLKQKMEQDSEQSRALILSEQEKLLSDLQASYRRALDTTLTDISGSLKKGLGSMAMLTAQEAQTVEKMVSDHQEKLTKVLDDHYSTAKKAVRSQIDPATESLDRLTDSLDSAMDGLNRVTKEAERSAKVSRRRWITGLVVGLSAFLIISGASWGLLQYLFGQVQQNLVTIDQQKETINRLNDQSLGLQIINDQKGTFLILPQHAEAGFSVGERSAIRLQRN